MQQFIEIYGFLSVLLRGAMSAAQSISVGGVGFLLLVVPLLAPAAGEAISAATRRLVVWSALAAAGLIALDAASLSLMLVGSLELDPVAALTADAVKADALALGPALVLAFAGRTAGGASRLALVLAALALLAARLGATHAVSRIDSPPTLALAEIAHLAGVALWIGGIPYFLMALSRAPDDETRGVVGRRFSRISMAGAALVVGGGSAMSMIYIGSVEAFYGLAYGVMVLAKIALLLGLLALGASNFFSVRRLRERGEAALLRLRRFAEAEIGVGFTVIFAAAALSSLPPAVDQPGDRVALADIVERLTPQWPIRLESPDHSTLSVARPAPNAAAAQAAETPIVVASAAVAPRNAEDIAWSEYNHHIAGLFVLAMGFLALLEHWPLAAPAARHWPLLMLGLAGFLFLRADEAVWPLGDLGLIESLRDPEIAQHRIFLALVVAFGVFEWRVRRRKVAAPWAPLAFPLITGLGGALLLAHSHALTDAKQEFLIEITHTPLALVGVTAAAARWLEIRLPDRAGRLAGLLWPIAFMLAGAMLLVYREA